MERRRERSGGKWERVGGGVGSFWWGIDGRGTAERGLRLSATTRAKASSILNIEGLLCPYAFNNIF
jgi:hypothetical protein